MATKNLLSNALKKEGLRHTIQRQAVWDEIKSNDDHRDAEQIYSALRKNNLNVSRATVYRTIDVLYKNNLIRKIELGDSPSKYENKVNSDHLKTVISYLEHTNVDIKIEFTGLRPAEKLYEELLADKETTLPTHHQKILIAKASHHFDESKNSLLLNLEYSISNNNEEKALKDLKKLVPEYVCLDETNSTQLFTKNKA